MQKNVLVSSLGKTPAVVTEMVDLLEERGIPIHEVVVFPARNVLSSYYVLLVDFKYGPYRGEKRIEKQELSFDDVRDERDCEEFRRVVEEVISEKVREGKRVIASVAGGRKTMPIDMLIAARKRGVRDVYHVIAEEKWGSWEELEALEKVHDLKAIAEGGTNPPKELVNSIVKMCHPEDLSLRLIRIPIEELS